jgi:hypothetical protein
MPRDYRDAKVYKNSTEARKDKAASSYVESRWWQETDPETRSSALIKMATALEDNSVERHQANLRHARLYENVELDTLTGVDYAQALIRQALYGTGIVRLNVIAACIDTLAAKIAKNKPRPNFITSGGSWNMQRKARALDKFMRGLFYETQVHNKAQQVFVDSCEFGTGMLHVYLNDDGRLDCERVVPDEIYVDDADAMYDAPRSLFRKKRVSREVLSAMFPSCVDDIYQSDESVDEASSLVSKDARTPSVDVWEAWHLPSKLGAKDGLHCITIDGKELFCERWNLDCFPFVKLRFKRRTLGFWGKGVAETLTGIQVELNRLVLSVSEQLRRKGKGRIFVQMGSKLNPNHMTNGIGDIVYYTGAPPVVDSQNAVAPEEFMQIDRLYQKAFQEVGISELSAAAKKPSGLDAAVALREYSDIESERFALVHQAWEQFFLDYAALCLKLISKQYGDKGYRIRMPSKRYVIEVDWKDINLDEDSYIMQMFPTSSLPQTPAARYAKVKEMRQDGFISDAVAKRLLEFPDIEAEMSLGNAAIDDADAVISAVLDNEKPEMLPIEPYEDLELIIERATASYLFARHFKDIEPERLDMLRQLIDNAAAMLAPPPAAMSAGPGMPAGPEMPMPTPPPAPGGGMAANVGNVNINAAPPVAPVTPPVIA